MSGSVREGDRQAVMRENKISKEVAVDSNRESKGEDDQENIGNQRGVRRGTRRGRVAMLGRDVEVGTEDTHPAYCSEARFWSPDG